METFIKNLVRSAGKILRAGFRKEFKFKTKVAAWDLVTEHDLAAERFIIRQIAKKYPNHGVFSEEAGRIKRQKNFWVIDPLDGTHAFARGLGQYGVSIAFVSGRNIVLGAVYDPTMDELFFARRNKGAALNGKKLRASKESQLDRVLVALLLGSVLTRWQERLKIYTRFVKEISWYPHLESVALTAGAVACARFDGLISKNLNPWDYAAGALILQEAGAKITEITGRPYRWNSTSLVAANPGLHKKLIKLLNLR